MIKTSYADENVVGGFSTVSVCFVHLKFRELEISSDCWRKFNCIVGKYMNKGENNCELKIVKQKFINQDINNGWLFTVWAL